MLGRGRRKRKQKKIYWRRKSIIFDQTRGGRRRWLPHTWHSCRTEATGQLHPNIVIVVITIVIFVIIIVIIIFVNVVTIVIVILISKSMEIVSGMVLFQILFRWHSVWNCFRYLNGDPESWAVLFANVESSLLKKKTMDFRLGRTPSLPFGRTP